MKLHIIQQYLSSSCFLLLRQDTFSIILFTDSSRYVLLLQETFAQLCKTTTKRHYLLYSGFSYSDGIFYINAPCKREKSPYKQSIDSRLSCCFLTGNLVSDLCLCANVQVVKVLSNCLLPCRYGCATQKFFCVSKWQSAGHKTLCRKTANIFHIKNTFRIFTSAIFICLCRS